jgi:hypothetical protein
MFLYLPVCTSHVPTDPCLGHSSDDQRNEEHHVTSSRGVAVMLCSATQITAAADPFGIIVSDVSVKMNSGRLKTHTTSQTNVIT